VTSPVSVSLDERGTRAAFTLYHPKGNIITAETVETLSRALETLADNPHLKLITFTGEGADFSFGASVADHAPEHIRAVLPAMHRLLEDILLFPATTAAIVRGRCLGGGFELALACDIIAAAADAEFGLPEVALGVFPPAASALLPWKVGGARAASAIITGASRTATEWHEAGLLEFLAPAGALDAAVDAWFDRHLASRSAAALRHAAAASRAGIVAHFRAIIPELERLYLGDLMRSHDAVEGIAAFLEKRAPRWTDR
jgi:cyclohexa-1,5-dienecarbonyl-CoA hydratase